MSTVERETTPQDWSIEQTREVYNIAHWSDGYFDISEDGRLIAYPSKDKTQAGIDLFELTKTIENTGLGLPVLVRFTDILKQRFATLRNEFQRANNDYGYRGEFAGIYPIKVNQQRGVVEAILSQGENHVGLEAGSKPELLAVLALSVKPGSVIVCNGYKDREYIRLALIGQRLGHKVYIVLEKLSELKTVLQESETMGIKPCLGMRIRLSSIGSGKWQDTCGEKAKFGFSAAQTLEVVRQLQEANATDLLQLLHFHLGSQIANIMDIQRGIRECARHYVELQNLGVNIRTIDVGGGLGVDYEGTHSRSHCSTNYTMKEYANNIVYALAEMCNENNLPHPNIITESGRAMTAHHAVLITNIIDVEETVRLDNLVQPKKDDPAILHDLWYGLDNINIHSALESYHDACHWISEVHSMYTHGVISLAEKAYAEQLYLATCFKVRGLLKHSVRAHREVIDELNEKLADKYFCNVSLFQSLPDAWAIDQVFPIIPLTGLDRKPTQRAVLQDITCDSDGRLKYYVDSQGVETTLPLPVFEGNEPKILGVFMVGAYQEILGDMHNLFGDTDSIQVELTEQGEYKLIQPLQGDSVEDVLDYVQFKAKDLIQSYKQQLAQTDLSTVDAQNYLQELIAGLHGYTYLEDY